MGVQVGESRHIPWIFLLRVNIKENMSRRNLYSPTFDDAPVTSERSSVPGKRSTR